MKPKTLCVAHQALPSPASICLPVLAPPMPPPGYALHTSVPQMLPDLRGLPGLHAFAETIYLKKGFFQPDSLVKCQFSFRSQIKGLLL